MASIACESAHFNHAIDKVAKWMATSDSQVCLFADDTSVSIVSSTTPSTSSVGEQGRQVLINQLKCDAVTRIKSLFRSTANQENNHNGSKKAGQNQAVSVAKDDVSSSSSSDVSPNRNQNNRRESEHRRKSPGDTRHRRQSQPSNSHSTAAQRKDGGDGGGGFKEDKYLERIVDRATQEIRSAIYKLGAENKLPEKCHLKMRLSIKPHRTSGSLKESPSREGNRTVGRRCSRSNFNSGRHRVSEQGDSRSERDKRGPSTAVGHREHREQKKDRRKY